MFGTGRLAMVPSTNLGVITQFAALQSVSVDFTGDVKELYGRNQFALDIARGKVKIQCKAVACNIDVNVYNSVFFGQTVATGQQLVAENEAGTIPTTPFQITVSGAATFTQDLGVTFVSTGVSLTRVASGPTTGQYSVSAVGVYTFAAADVAKAVLISYQYSAAGTGSQIAIGNALMGAIPTFQAVLNGTFKNKVITLTLYACVANKLTLPLKQDDYMMPEFDFQAQDNGSGSVGILSATNT
jgi:hypothetical protein